MLSVAIYTDLDGCRSTWESHQGASSLISHSRTGGVQQVVDASDKPRSLWWIGMANLPNK